MTGIGLLLSLILFSMGLLPLLFILLGVNLLIRGGSLLVTGVVMITLGLLISLLVGFFLPVELAWYAREGRLEVAFHLTLLWQGIEKNLSRYLRAYLFSLSSFLFLALLTSLPFVGFLLWPFLIFYFMLVWAHLFGQVLAFTPS